MSDQAVKKRYLTIFFDLLGELYVHILSVKVFVKIIDSIFVYGGECVITQRMYKQLIDEIKQN